MRLHTAEWPWASPPVKHGHPVVPWRYSKLAFAPWPSCSQSRGAIEHAMPVYVHCSSTYLRTQPPIRSTGVSGRFRVLRAACLSPSYYNWHIYVVQSHWTESSARTSPVMLSAYDLIEGTKGTIPEIGTPSVFQSSSSANSRPQNHKQPLQHQLCDSLL